jgi:hypothetical protein
MVWAEALVYVLLLVIDTSILFMINCSMEFGMGMITASVLDSMGGPDIDASAETRAY